jgi:hypothetical protein
MNNSFIVGAFQKTKGSYLAHPLYHRVWRCQIKITNLQTYVTTVNEYSFSEQETSQISKLAVNTQLQEYLNPKHNVIIPNSIKCFDKATGGSIWYTPDSTICIKNTPTELIKNNFSLKALQEEEHQHWWNLTKYGSLKQYPLSKQDSLTDFDKEFTDNRLVPNKLILKKPQLLIDSYYDIILNPNPCIYNDGQFKIELIPNTLQLDPNMPNIIGLSFNINEINQHFDFVNMFLKQYQSLPPEFFEYTRTLLNFHTITTDSLFNSLSINNIHPTSDYILETELDSILCDQLDYFADWLDICVINE